MAALSAGSITYTIKNARRLGNSKVFNRVQMTFASGQTYPTGGVAFTQGNAGLPNAVESVIIEDDGTSGYSFNYNSSTAKVQFFTGGATLGNPMAELANTITPGAITIFVDVIGW